MDAFDELEKLDVIEAEELNVGNAFHAFRFSTINPDEAESDINLKSDTDTSE